MPPVAEALAAERPRSTPKTTHLTITVLAGGPSDEREVSLQSGQAVRDALIRRGHQVTMLDISPKDLSALDQPCDCVFIALHGAFGEDGAIQKVLERRAIKFCGSDSRGSALAMDKVAAKMRFVEHGVPTPRFDVVRKPRIDEVVENWTTPVMVKPVRSGSSVDTYLIRDKERLGETLRAVIKKHGDALIEAYIQGPELTVGLLDGRALPPIEIRTKREFYDYQAKYVDDDTQYLFDIPLPQNVLARIGDLSVRAAEGMGCRDFCRVDWMVDAATHEPYALEINTIPGFTSHSLLPKAAARVGISFDELVQRIVNCAMRRSQE
jgi:D-alanine-D-alanine ligase